ncbi:MAG: membrane protein [Bacillota bacterium]|nr:membrane protein [Bacillota bacterium]
MQRRHLIIAAKFLVLASGFFLLAYGSIMGVVAALGVAPWHVLHIGLTKHFPITLGRAAQFTGFVILALAVALGVRPRIGTWCNMFLVGYFLDFVTAYKLVPQVSTLPMRVLYVLLGAVVSGLGVAGYICADLGTGPRDSLMLGVTRRTGWRVGTVRSTIEVSVVVVGLLLGGPVGLGTLASAMMAGPVVEWLLLTIEKLVRLPFLCDVIKLPSSIRIGKRVVTPGATT